MRLIKESLSLEQIDKRASELGLNRSQFVTKALIMIGKLRSGFLEKNNPVRREPADTGMGCYSNMLIKRFAREDAEAQVFRRQQDAGRIYKLL